MKKQLKFNKTPYTYIKRFTNQLIIYTHTKESVKQLQETGTNKTMLVYRLVRESEKRRAFNFNNKLLQSCC